MYLVSNFPDFFLILLLEQDMPKNAIKTLLSNQYD